ncbi:hypothetical protein D9758_005945 [Tetrapyrgos nigripes]|uniref:Homeobox domain-containing protein n=1 Tax=Tetrapyrgos nigripes TaxID=182062 RepID=A0A8H5LHJ1_9AGAR|nr:hypothetical protein D9758_005945 [Tetrapyrgos nigripes]
MPDTKKKVIPKEGKEFLKTVFHRYQVLLPGREEREHVLRELKHVVPGCEDVTMKMVNKWFSEERKRTGGQNTTLSNSKKCHLEVWFTQNPEPSEDVVTLWSKQLKVDRKDVVYWVVHKMFDRTSFQPALPPPPEQVALETVIHLYNQAFSPLSPVNGAGQNTIPSFQTSGIDAPMSMDYARDDAHDVPQSPPHDDIMDIETQTFLSEKFLPKVLFSIAADEVDRFVTGRAQRTMKEATGHEVTLEIDSKRCPLQTAQDVKDLFGPCHRLFDKVMELVDHKKQTDPRANLPMVEETLMHVDRELI